VTVADTSISSVKVLASLAWLKHTDLAGHWLVQHTAPDRAKPYSRPRLEGGTTNTRQAVYSYLTPPSAHVTYTSHTPTDSPLLPRLVHWTFTYGLSTEVQK